MIVGNFSALGRSIRETAPRLFRVFVWAIMVTVFFVRHETSVHGIVLPLALFGSAIALFLGFRVNAAYARWWEARTLWGHLVGASRNIGRQLATLLDRKNDLEADLMRQLIHRQVAYAHSVRCTLRGEDCEPDLRRYLSTAEVSELKRNRNIPNAVLNGSAQLLADAARKSQFNPFLWMRIEATFAELALAQGGAERIKATPLPIHFRVIPDIWVEVFCFILPLALIKEIGIYTPIAAPLIGMMLISALQTGNDLKDPFANKAHDIPMSAMCRTIEIDLLETLGEPAPEPLAPVGHILM